MPVMLSFWGKEENKAAVTDLMARRGFKLNIGGSGATGTIKKGGTLNCLISPVSLWNTSYAIHIPKLNFTEKRRFYVRVNNLTVYFM